jgi:hypothetical protein
MLLTAAASNRRDNVHCYIVAAALIDRVTAGAADSEDEPARAERPHHPGESPPPSNGGTGAPRPSPETVVGTDPHLTNTAARCIALLAAAGDWRLRLQAAELLQLFPAETISSAHRRLLNDDFWPVRYRALRALASLPPGDNLRCLTDVMRRQDAPDFFERIEAARLLTELQNAAGLVIGLSDPHPAVRLKCVQGLGRLPALTAEAAAALTAALDTAERGLKQEINRVLAAARDTEKTP